jgi:hypothetical protein
MFVVTHILAIYFAYLALNDCSSTIVERQKSKSTASYIVKLEKSQSWIIVAFGLYGLQFASSLWGCIFSGGFFDHLFQLVLVSMLVKQLNEHNLSQIMGKLPEFLAFLKEKKNKLIVTFPIIKDFVSVLNNLSSSVILAETTTVDEKKTE